MTTTVEIDERGRLVIPQAMRKLHDIDGERAIVEVDITEVHRIVEEGEEESE